MRYEYHEYQQVQQLVRQAGQKAKQLRQEKFEISEKEPGDYVTSIDLELDRLLSASFSDWFPHDCIITEENADSYQIWQQQEQQANNSRCWFIDPIDGTNDFVRGDRHYAVMVGLMEHGLPVMGWVYAPESDRLFFGGKAIGGVYVQDGDAEPIKLDLRTPEAQFCKIIISHKDKRRYGNAVLQAIPTAEFYNLGSFGLKVADVLLGKACLYIYLNRRVKLWDTVGPLAMAMAAGLVCCDLDGQAIGFASEHLNPGSLVHNQVILVGWAEHMDTFRQKLNRSLDLQF
ncbi:inositol monophosphatase [Thalassoporum mexicanum PCC 7367]|uniref:3'(2'),5'-bisphosphate nucleotidase CysQ family protein n=1 Tax=Thalassoporum mexicanum TaxID=3457544 RepID=UPI00029F913A|nr:inositol monophosphatase family protein [Pseudanabaena sp. PCC 7367]AFY70428.1 inositol monophosphatase [Pseudanabaena sp. PCC 7367]